MSRTSAISVARPMADLEVDSAPHPFHRPCPVQGGPVSHGMPTTLDTPSILAIVAHDLRTPLAGLAATSELLSIDVDVLDSEQIRRMASSIHHGAIWLQGLVENILCAATIRDGRLRIQPSPMNLLELVREAELVTEPLLARKKLRLKLSSRGPWRLVLVDGRRIGQVLINLIANAVKFSEEESVIGITMSAGARTVRLSVTDRGPGFPVDFGPRLFEPFYCVPGSGKKGVGLGLAIVKWLVEAHGGRVGAENRRGGGACFWLELPASPITSFADSRV